MKPTIAKAISISLSFFLIIEISIAQTKTLQFDFDQNVKASGQEFSGKQLSFTDGIEGKAVVFNPAKGYTNLSLDNLQLDGTEDFTVQCWIKTTSKKPQVILSQKRFHNKGIVSQKNSGWALYSSGGTFGWSVGSGNRRINYERDNGEKMSITDGQWHQMTLTYSKSLSEFRLYYDGQNKAIYKVNFDFSNLEPLVIGSIKDPSNMSTAYSSEIKIGLDKLQNLVEAFNDLDLEPLKNDEFLDLIVSPEDVLNKKLENIDNVQKVSKENLTNSLEIRKELVSNPYTVFQNRSLTDLKPVSKIYELQSGKVVINDTVAKSFTEDENLYPSDFAMDNLSIWEETMGAKDILTSYTNFKEANKSNVPENLKDLTVGVWNIWHGGIHWTKEKDGWDSRQRIVEMIKEKNIDVILMQETYSAGDLIAAELGYYFATTSDWDYRYQGANISVISRFPIEEVQVLEETEFNNVAIKMTLSESQEIWAMSNWYGMSNFESVYNFHETRFENTDNVPVLFGGDFNAVPHTDGGDSPASKKLLDAGFTDAFRSLYPDVDKDPGFSHRSGERIDQLYYKGKGLSNTFTETISSWPTGFPSDHYLILSKFELNY
tara:strand:+ start:1900 stop:3705 length:1806 start_codon:yes stop_codon:yes gene_type:complete